VPTIPLGAVLVVSALLLWVITYFSPGIPDKETNHSIIFNFLLKNFEINPVVLNLLSAPLVVFNAFLLAHLNNRYTIIRNRTFLPILIYLLLMSAWSVTHTLFYAHFCTTLFIVALLVFFNMYHRRDSSEQAFLVSLLLSVCSLIIFDYIYLVPAFWIAFMMFRSFSLRIFLASVFGALTPWIILAGTLFIFNPAFDITLLFRLEFIPELTLPVFSAGTMVYLGVLILAFLVNVFGLLSGYDKDAIHTRSKLKFMLYLAFVLLVLVYVFRSEAALVLPLLALPVAFIISYPATLKQSNFYNLTFIVFCVINILYVIGNFIVQ